MISKIKGAIFDMDGTLIDSLMVWEVLWRRFGDKFLNGESFSLTDAEEKTIRTMTLRGAMEYIYSIYKIGGSVDALLDTANELIEEFYSSQVELKKGVREFLEYCKSAKIKMCIASATDIKLIKVAMKHCEIESYFEDVLSCATIGKGKECPDIYLLALERLGTSKEETCVFEDSHIAIKTASEIGMLTVGIYDKYNYGQEEMKRIANEYIANGETLKKLIAE